MKDTKRIATIISWIARIWGTLSLVFMLFFVGAHLISSITGKGEALGHPSISFVFFPVSIIIGLIVAFKWEGLGGLITIAGIIGFHLLRPDLFLSPMIDGLAAPGIFYIFYWVLSKDFSNKTT